MNKIIIPIVVAIQLTCGWTFAQNKTNVHTEEAYITSWPLVCNSAANSLNCLKTGVNSEAVIVTSWNQSPAAYYVVGRKNRIIVETVPTHAQRHADYQYEISLYVQRSNDQSTNTSETVVIPLSHTAEYRSVENDRSVYLFSGDGYSKIKVTGYSIKDENGIVVSTSNSQSGSGGQQQAPALVENFKIRLIIEEERYFIDQSTLQALQCSTTATDNHSFIHASWTPTGASVAAEPCWYQLEWVYLENDDQRLSSYPKPFTLTNSSHFEKLKEYFREGATRIERKFPINDQDDITKFSVRNAFAEAGTMYMRYRRVRPTYFPAGQSTPAYIDYQILQYSEWQYGLHEINSTNANLFPENDLNWTYQSVFMEEGKHKDVINFFDGSGKSRQTLTHLSSQSGVLLADQTMYDYAGNPVVKPLPVPVKPKTGENEFNFQSNLNSFTNDKADYDEYSSGNRVMPGNIESGSKADDYYKDYTSGTHPFSTSILSDMIPNAEGYPYSYTEMIGDGSGRPLRVSGVGEQYRIHNNTTEKRYTKYGYAEPEQELLDMLFGNNAGVKSYYKQTVVKDPNGQVTLTITDGHGRTVATGIASPPENMYAIDNRPAPFNLASELLNNDNNQLSDDGLSKVHWSPLYIANENTTVTFDYSIQFDPFTWCDGDLCRDCKYIWEAFLIDMQGNKIDLFYQDNYVPSQCQFGGSESFRFSTDAPGVNLTKVLGEGTYYVVKKLTPKIGNADISAIKADLQDPNNDCLKSKYEFTEEEIASEDFNTCLSNYGNPSPCDDYKAQMMADMVPRKGKYALLPSDFTNNEFPSPFSLLMANNTPPTALLVKDDFENSPKSKATIYPFYGNVNSLGPANAIQFLADAALTPGGSSLFACSSCPGNYMGEYVKDRNFLTSPTQGNSFGLILASSPYCTSSCSGTLIYEKSFTPSSIKGGLYEFTMDYNPMLYYNQCFEDASYLPKGTFDLKLILYSGSTASPTTKIITLQSDQISDLYTSTGNHSTNWTTIIESCSTVVDVHKIQVVLEKNIDTSTWTPPGDRYPECGEENYVMVGIDGLTFKHKPDQACPCKDIVTTNCDTDCQNKGSSWSFPFNCLKGAFGSLKASDGITNPADLASASLFAEEFYKLDEAGQQAWLEVMILAHPEYCNLALCEILNSKEVLEFGKDLTEIETLAEFQSRYPKFSLRDTILPDSSFMDIDPLFQLYNNSSGPQGVKFHPNPRIGPIYNAMDSYMKTMVQSEDVGGIIHSFSMNQMAMIQVAGPLLTRTPAVSLGDIATELERMTVSLNSNLTGALGEKIRVSGMEEEYFKAFKALYTGFRAYVSESAYGPCSECFAIQRENMVFPYMGTGGVGITGSFNQNKSMGDKYMEEFGQDLKDMGINGVKSKHHGNSKNIAQHQMDVIQRTTDCEIYLEDEIRKNFPIVHNSSTGKDHIRSLSDITVDQLVQAFLPGCLGTAGSAPADIKAVLQGTTPALLVASPTNEQYLEVNPYLIDINHPLHQKKPDLNVLSSDVSQTTNWAALDASADGTTVYTSSSFGSSSEYEIIGLPTSVTSYTVTPGSINPHVKAFSDYLAKDNRITAGYYFSVDIVDQGGNPIGPLFAISENKVYDLNSSVAGIFDSPKPEDKLNCDYANSQLLPAFFEVENSGSGCGIPLKVLERIHRGSNTANEQTYWDNNYEVMFENFANHHSGIRVAYHEYQDFLSTCRSNTVVNSLSTSTYSCLLGTPAALDQTVATQMNLQLIDPSLCDNLDNFNDDVVCGDCYTMYDNLLSYVSDPGEKLSPDFMTATHINSSSVASLIPGWEAHYSLEEVIGESNHLFLVRKDDQALLGVKSLLEDILITYQGQSSYTDKNTFAGREVDLPGKFLSPVFPQGSSNSYINIAGYHPTNSKQFNYDLSATKYSSWVSTQTSVRMWAHQNSNGNLWLHMAYDAEKRYEDVRLFYYLYNREFKLSDVTSIVSIEPYATEAGKEFNFIITVEVNNDPEDRHTIIGESSIKVADVCLVPYFVLGPVPEERRQMPGYSCEYKMYKNAEAEGIIRYEEYLKEQLANIEAAYRDHCLNSAIESFTKNQAHDLANWTLYYYDQAGNLIQTVPPEGVNMITDPADLAVVKAFRDGSGGTPLFPQHIKQTQYAYTSNNAVQWQKTPDGGSTQFKYDLLGRVVASQNAEQESNNKFNYSIYDHLSRLRETGEFNAGSYQPPGGATNNGWTAVNEPFIEDYGLLKSHIVDDNSHTRYHVVKHYYDEDGLGLSTGYGIQLENTLNRIASSAFFEYYVSDGGSPGSGTGINFQNAIHYSYDIQGNVKSMWRHILETGLDELRRIDYEYDLVSGNVKKVKYQNGFADDFFHKYEYDADNRIVNASISKDDIVYEDLASYQYYLHGPLARTIIGDKKVQSLEYAYTLQGWLKSVNGIGGNHFGSAFEKTDYAHDVFAYELAYNEGDYEAVKSGSFDNAAYPSSLESQKKIGLYNGNIAGFIMNYYNGVKFDGSNYVAQGGQFNKWFRYDQLNRIKRYYEADEVATEQVSDYKFDFDGNLTTLNRKGGIPTTNSNGDLEYAWGSMDELSYNYINNTNKLTHVNEGQTNDEIFIGDIENQEANDYKYDKIGNLTTDASEGSFIEWNPIGKIKNIDAIAYGTGMANTDDNVIGTLTTDATHLNFEYDPMGDRIRKTTIDYTMDLRLNVLSDVWDDVNSEFFGIYYYFDGKRIRKVVPTDDGQGNYYYPVDGSSISQEEFESIIMSEYNQVYRDQYYIRDASGNTMAMYQKTVGLPKTSSNVLEMLNNVKVLGNLSDAQVKEKFVEDDLIYFYEFVKSNLNKISDFHQVIFDTIPVDTLIERHPIVAKKLALEFALNYAPLFYLNNEPFVKGKLLEFEEFRPFFDLKREEELNAMDPPARDALLAPHGGDPLVYIDYIWEQAINDPLERHDNYYYEDVPGLILYPEVEEMLTNDFFVTLPEYQTWLKGYLATGSNRDEILAVESMEEVLAGFYNPVRDQFYDVLLLHHPMAGDDQEFSIDLIVNTSDYKLDHFFDRSVSVTLDSDAKKKIINADGSNAQMYAFGDAFSLTLSDHHTYGSDRVGIVKHASQVEEPVDELNPSGDQIHSHYAGLTRFEVKDHLGNIRTLISDRKKRTPGASGSPDSYDADVIEYNDYYPYGAPIVHRSESYEVDVKYSYELQTDKNKPIYSLKGSWVIEDGSQLNNTGGLDRFSTVYYFYDPVPARTRFDFQTGISNNMNYVHRDPNTGVWNFQGPRSYTSNLSFNSSTGLKFYKPASVPNVKKYEGSICLGGFNNIDRIKIQFEYTAKNAKNIRIAYGDYHTRRIHRVPIGGNLSVPQQATIFADYGGPHQYNALQVHYEVIDPSKEAYVNLNGLKYGGYEISGYGTTPSGIQEVVDEGYRYGFQAQEVDREWKGPGEDAGFLYQYMQPFNERVVFEDDFSGNLSNWLITWGGNVCAAVSNGKLLNESTQYLCGAESKAFDVPPHKRYQLTVNAENQSSGQFLIYWDYWDPSANSGAGGWVNFDLISVVANSGMTTYTKNNAFWANKMRIRMVPNSANYTKVYIDDIRVEEYLDALSTWARSDGKMNTVYDATTQSAKLQPIDSWGGFSTKDITLTPGKTYTVSYDLDRAQYNGATQFVILNYKDAQGNYHGVMTHNGPHSAGKSKEEFTFTAQHSTYSMHFGHHQPTNPMSDISLIDNIRITDGTKSPIYASANANSVAFKYRIHDPRIGRFLSIDPLMMNFPWNSPFVFSENRVFDSIELEGAERLEANTAKSQKFLDSYLSLMYKDEILWEIGVSLFTSCKNPKHIIYVVNSSGWVPGSDGSNHQDGRSHSIVNMAKNFLKYKDYKAELEKKGYELDEFEQDELTRYEDIFKDLGLSPEEVIKRHEEGYIQDVVVADDDYTLAHELILHEMDVVDNGHDDTNTEEEHIKGHGEKYYIENPGAMKSPPREKTPSDSMMGKIYDRMDAARKKP